MKTTVAFRLATSSVLLAATLSTLCLAQPEAPQIARVQLIHIKPDMLTEWLDLQKNEVVPALKKAGEKSRTVYVTSLFGNAYEYVIITPIGKYADLDAGNPVTKALGQPAAFRLNDKLRKCTESSTSYAITRLTELSNVPEGPMPKMLVTARYRIAPGKAAEFRSLVKSEILPVYKKAKNGLLVNARGVGANPNDITMSTVISNFADLDGGPFLTKQLGQEAAAKVNAKFVGIRTLIEVYVRSKVDDLSF